MGAVLCETVSLFEAKANVIAIRLFGVPSVSRDAVPLPLAAPPRALALLAYLATRPGELIPRELLATLLWPDAPEADGRANLRRHVHLLTRALPAGAEPWLLASATTLAFNPRAPAWVDAVEFARASGSGNEPERAVTLYAAEFMVGFEDDWIVERRLRLAQLQLDNLDQLLTRAIAARDTGPAIAYAQAMLRCDPWREDAVRHLIRLRRQAGDRAGALVEYERFAQRLRAEIEVDPMPETLAEYQSVLHDVPARPAVPAPQSAGARAPFELPFVGRQIELEGLETALSRAARGYGRLVLVGGEAGAGKSRLLAELRAIAERDGVLLLRGTTPIVEASPYQVVAETLGAAQSALEGAVIEPIWLAALATIVPEIGRRNPALPALPELDPERDRRRLFEAISVVLTRLAAAQPLLVEFEDLHWAGPATIALLEDLARNLAGHRILIVATYREEELERGHALRFVRRRLLRAGLVDRVSVGLLTQREVEAAIAPFAAGADRAELARELYARTDGNAFFLGELVRDRLERRAAGDAGADGTPPALHETILARLGRLSEAGRAVTAIAAVIGRAFDVDLVRAIGGWRERDLLDALDELVERGIVREVGAAGNDYAFAHHLIQASAYEQTPEPQRRRRHRRVALALEELYQPRVDELALEIAHHFEAGGEPELAASYFVHAAANALDLLANDDAVAFASRGLALAAVPAVRRRLLLLREAANERRGERAAQRADLEALAADASGTDELERFELVRRRCALAHALGERREQARLVELLGALAERSGAARQAAIAALARGSFLWYGTSRYDEASAALAEGFALASAAAPDVALQCAVHCARIATFRGRHAEAAGWLERARALVAGERASPEYALLLTEYCTSALGRSDYGAVARRADELLEVADAMGDLRSRAIAHYHTGVAAAWRFDVARARSALAEAERLFTHLDDKAYVVRTLTVRGNLDVKVGRFGDAIAAHREVERLAAAIDYEVMKAIAAINIAYDAAMMGDLDEAYRAGKRGVRLSRAARAPQLISQALTNLAIVERERGSLERAIEYLEAALAQARELAGDPVTLAGTLAQLAETYRRAGRGADAVRAATEMLGVHDETNVSHPQLPWWIAAQVYRDSDPSRAAACLQRAHDLLQRRAEAIPDAASRASFFALSYNRELLAAHGSATGVGRFSDAGPPIVSA